MKLYEINHEIEMILESIDDELTDEQFQALTDLEMKREEKIENTALYIKQLRAETEMLENERKRLQKKEQASKNRVKRLEEYLNDMLGGQKYKSPLNNIYYGTTKGINIIDKSKIPKDFLINQDPIVSKREIQKAIEGGKEVAGVKAYSRKYMVLR